MRQKEVIPNTFKDNKVRFNKLFIMDGLPVNNFYQMMVMNLQQFVTRKMPYGIVYWQCFDSPPTWFVSYFEIMEESNLLPRTR